MPDLIVENDRAVDGVIFVRNDGPPTLEEAIRKMTSLYVGCGRKTRPKGAADRVASVVGWSSPRPWPTCEGPRQLPEGIDPVVAGGEKTVEGGKHPGTRNGLVLERSGG